MKVDEWSELVNPLLDLFKRSMDNNAEEVRRLTEFHEFELNQVISERDRLQEDSSLLAVQNRHLEIARHVRESASGYDPLESDIFRQNQVIWNLMQRNSILANDVPYIKNLYVDQKIILSQEASDTTFQIQSELDSLGQIFETCRPTVLSIPSGGNLEVLLKYVLRDPAHGMLRGQEMDFAESLAQSNLQQILRYLVLTRVKEQVFYTDFPASGMKNTWWSVLQEHRKLQMDLGKYTGATHSSTVTPVDDLS